MVRQRVSGTEWCIQMPLMIVLSCRCQRAVSFVVDAVVTHPHARSALKHPRGLWIPWAQTFELLSVQAQPGLFAQSPRSVNVVIPLLDRIKSELCVAAYTSLSPPPVLGALGRCEVSLRAAWAEPGQVCLTWLNPLWLLHSHLAVPHLCSRKKTIFKLLVYVWKRRVYFRGLLGYENKPVVELWRGYL